MTVMSRPQRGLSPESNAQYFASSSSRAEAASQILGEIVRSSKPSARLGTKEELRRLCEVSVGTFNEALKIAQNRGIVALRPGPGGGIFSQAPSAIVRLGNLFLELDNDEQTVAEAVHVRNGLDFLLMDDALEYRTSTHLVQLRSGIVAMRQAVIDANPTEFMRSNWHLHAVLANISPNSILRNFYLGLLEVIEQHTLAVQPAREQPLQDYIEYRLALHERMVDAVESQDARLARVLVEEHNTENYQKSVPTGPVIAGDA
jgi:DNA-binding FadR family transcriptional regulator